MMMMSLDHLRYPRHGGSAYEAGQSQLHTQLDSQTVLSRGLGRSHRRGRG